MTEFNQAKGKWKAAEAVSKEAEKKEKASSEELVNCTSLIKRFEGNFQITRSFTRSGRPFIRL